MKSKRTCVNKLKETLNWTQTEFIFTIAVGNHVEITVEDFSSFGLALLNPILTHAILSVFKQVRKPISAYFY